MLSEIARQYVLATDAFTAHQTIGEVALFKSCVVGSGSTDKHFLILQEKQERKLCNKPYYGTTKRFWRPEK